MPIARFITLAAALTLPTAAHAQPGRIQPGTPLDTTFIAPRTDSLVMMIEHEGETLRAGYFVLETRAGVADGVRRVVHVQRMLIEGEPEAIVADSAYFHWSTLLPISVHTRGDTPYDLHFGPRSVRVTLLPRTDGFDTTGGDSSVSEVALDGPVFYTAPDLLLRALPLRAGYRAVLPAVGRDGSASELHVAVTGEETVPALDGTACPVLVVEIEHPDFDGTFRISPVDRSVVRFDADGAVLLVREAGCP